MSDDTATADALAKRRFFIIQAVRLAGVVMALLALLVLNGKLAWPPMLGYFLLLDGLFNALFLPTLLARRWQTPK
jgi:hypothetical protein